MAKWHELPTWQRRGIAGVGILGLAFGVGVKTHHIEVMDAEGNGFRQSGVRGGSIEIPLLDKKIYISEKPFTNDDLVSNKGVPLHPDPSMVVYRSNAILKDPSTTVSSLQTLGVFCPNDAATQAYNPPPSETKDTTSPVLSVDMRVCLDFGKAATSGGGVSVPLALEQTGNLPPMQLMYKECSPETRMMFSRYAGIVNEQIINIEHQAGQQTSAATHYSVNIMSNPVAPGPCDTNAVQNGHR